jgi:hypothetical protein
LNSYSIIELNVGIICSCIPVVVVLFKDFGKNPRIMSLRRYIRSRYASGQSDSDSEELGQKPEQYLPDVPKGTLSGLKTFVRKFDRSQRGEATQVSNFSHLASSVASSDESYHEVLKANK